MPWLRMDADAFANADDVARIEFRAGAGPLGEQARLLGRGGVATGDVSSIPGLQRLRALIGDGSGSTGWWRVRTDGTIRESYVNLARVAVVRFVNEPQGQVGRLTAANDVELGRVTEPALVRGLRQVTAEG